MFFFPRKRTYSSEINKVVIERNTLIASNRFEIALNEGIHYMTLGIILAFAPGHMHRQSSDTLYDESKISNFAIRHFQKKTI